MTSPQTICCNFTEDTVRPLRNPGMGWLIYIDQDGSTLTPGHPGRYLDAASWWEEMEAAAAQASILYIRLPWVEFEPIEGHYAWVHNENFKAIIQGALARGLTLAFRIYVDCSDCQLQATPLWVREAGARGKLQVENPGDGGPKWNPFLEDPVFRRKLEQFIAAFAREFDDPARVTFIDAEGLGRWGEMHTFHLEDPARYVELGRDCIRWIVRTYRRYFHRVLLGHQFQNWSLGKDIDDEILGVCGYLARRDGLASPIWFKQEEKDRLKSYWPQSPTFAENCYWHNVSNEKWWRGDGFTSRRALFEQLLRDAEEIHANTLDLRIAEDANAWIQECPDLVTKFQLQGGYRLSPVAVKFSQQVGRDQPVKIQHVWKNSGWGRLPGDLPQWKGRFAVAFALLSAGDDHPRCIVLSTADPSGWLRGQNASYEEAFSFPSVPAGTYNLALAIVDTTQAMRPAIDLAITHDRTVTGWHPLAPYDFNQSSCGQDSEKKRV